MSGNIIEEKEEHLSGLAINLENGIILAISDGEYRVGTLAIGVPLSIEEKKTAAVTFPVFGTRNEIFAKSMAERTAHEMNRIAIVIISLKKAEEDSAMAYKLLRRILDKIRT
ncbi:MAG: hypothetical protein ACFFA1_04195 [Promethearchaeota archaeon]